MLEKIFGASYKTTLGSIVTAITLVPQAIQTLQIEEIPQWLRIVSLICAGVSFVYTGMQTKDKNVTGAGVNAVRVEETKEN